MERKRFIKKILAIAFVVLLSAIVISIILKYSVEGEKNMPFQISKIMLISTASGIDNESKDNRWDLNIIQNSDIYIDIIKNKNYIAEEIIDKIIIDNIHIEKEPQKGKINLYRVGEDTKHLNMSEEYKIENELIFTGSETSNLENLEIANQGGLIIIRCINEELGRYVSNEDSEIRHDGGLLSKIGITNEEIKYTISFDISIELKSEKKYKACILLEIPNENIIEKGTTNLQINSENIVFKRY